MIHLEINGEYHYEDYFSTPHADRKIYTPLSARIKSDIRFQQRTYDSRNLCTTQRTAWRKVKKDSTTQKNSEPIETKQDITEAVNLLIRNVRAINKWTTSLLNMDLLIEGELTKSSGFGREKVEIQARMICVKMQLRNILPEFRMGRLSLDIGQTKDVSTKQSYRGSELLNFSDIDALQQIVSKLTRKVLQEDRKVDKLRRAYANFIAIACSNARKPGPEFYANYMQDFTLTVVDRLNNFFNPENGRE